MRTKKVIREVSKQYNTTPKEVEREMELAMKYARTNPETQDLWQQKFGDKMPTVEEFIRVMVNGIE